MKKVMMFLIVAVFLMSFAFAGITGSATQDNSNGNTNQINSNQNKGTLTQSQIKEIVKNKNRLTIKNVGDLSECPNTCTCTGSVTTCQLLSGREMTITAGKSGNIIVQIKGENMTTNVTLYKADGKLYGKFKGNVTKRILDPEQAQDRVKEKLQLRNITLENLELNENGYYEVQTKKKSRLFLFIPIREKVKAQVTAENGEVKIRNPWWGFLAKDVEEEPILGGTCGTVSPDSRNECCQNRGYDVYDSEKGECVFEE